MQSYGLCQEVFRKNESDIKISGRKSVDMPSGVKNEFYTKDIDGDPIDLKKIKAADVPGKKKKATYIRKPLAEKIVAFAKK